MVQNFLNVKIGKTCSTFPNKQQDETLDRNILNKLPCFNELECLLKFSLAPFKSRGTSTFVYGKYHWWN